MRIKMYESADDNKIAFDKRYIKSYKTIQL